MSKKENKAAKIEAAKAKKEIESKQVVKMRFKEDKFYNDLDKPLYLKGEIYEIKGADMIQRWIKRGGEIVQGELKMPKHEVNPSEVVSNAPPKQEVKPELPKEEEKVANEEEPSDSESIQDEQESE